MSKNTKRNGHFLTTDDSLVGRQCETESKRSSSDSSPMLSPTILLDVPSKICMEVATTKSNDSDELELATSESSESDKSWQSHDSHARAPKATSFPNGLVSKTRKSTLRRQAENQETRYSYLG